MYSHLVLGGTFDHLHAGHRQLIAEAFSQSHKVLLGLTMSEMNVHKAFSQSILSFSQRRFEIEEFVTSLGRIDDLMIIPISDVFGTTLTDASLEAILVTPHSLAGAEKINQARVAKNLPELEVLTCELFTDDSGVVLSSTRIREGLVNRSGSAYEQLFKETIQISESIKNYVREPLGEIHFTFPTELAGDENNLIFVGDVVTETAIAQNLNIASAWIDGKSYRDEYQIKISTNYKLVELGLENKAGTIDKDVVAFMLEHLNSRQTIYKIKGEEDLLALVAIMLAPLGSKVIYGNPFGQKGICIVHVSEEKKEEVNSLLISGKISK